MKMYESKNRLKESNDIKVTNFKDDGRWTSAKIQRGDNKYDLLVIPHENYDGDVPFIKGALSLPNQPNKRIFSYDRGWDIEPTDPDAKAIYEFVKASTKGSNLVITEDSDSSEDPYDRGTKVYTMLNNIFKQSKMPTADRDRAITMLTLILRNVENRGKFTAKSEKLTLAYVKKLQQVDP